MRILVAGGAGYIGAHMCKLLAQQGHELVALDNFVTGHRAAVRWGELVEGSLHDSKLLDGVFGAHRYDAVMHFASSIAVGESVREPLAYYHNNVAGTLGLLSAMKRHGVRRLVFSSTAALYGEPQYTPLDEKHPTQPVSPYGHSKLMVEQILRDAAAAGHLDAVALRYFNAAGADPDGELGEAHDPETHLIPLLLQAALGKAPPVTLFGDDYPTPDGTCIRDYIHVSEHGAGQARSAPVRRCPQPGRSERPGAREAGLGAEDSGARSHHRDGMALALRPRILSVPPSGGRY